MKTEQAVVSTSHKAVVLDPSGNECVVEYEAVAYVDYLRDDSTTVYAAGDPVVVDTEFGRVTIRVGENFHG